MTRRIKKTKGIKRKNPETRSSSDGFSTPDQARTRDHICKEPSAPHRSAIGVEAQQSLPAAPIDNALVFDIAAYVHMKNVDTAISTLRSSLKFRNLDPSELLYDELLDCLRGLEKYVDAYSIYSALVWVFDSEFAKSKGTNFVFPHTLDPLTGALQDASVQKMDGEGSWRRNLLVIKLLVYCLQRDFRACRQRSTKPCDRDSWMGHTRMSALLQADDSGAIPERSVCNDWILQAVGWCMAIWKRIHNTSDNAYCELERGDTCDAVLRLIEMLFECTTQVDNVVQRIYTGEYELLPDTQALFMAVIQSHDLILRLGASEQREVDRSRSPAAAPPLTAFQQLTLELNRLAKSRAKSTV